MEATLAYLFPLDTNDDSLAKGVDLVKAAPSNCPQYIPYSEFLESSDFFKTVVSPSDGVHSDSSSETGYFGGVDDDFGTANDAGNYIGDYSSPLDTDNFGITNALDFFGD